MIIFQKHYFILRRKMYHQVKDQALITILQSNL